MTQSWNSQHEAWDRLSVDHLAACPDCGDLAHPGSTVCDGCGCHLFVRVISAAARDLSVAREPVDEGYDDFDAAAGVSPETEPAAAKEAR